MAKQINCARHAQGGEQASTRGLRKRGVAWVRHLWRNRNRNRRTSNKKESKKNSPQWNIINYGLASPQLVHNIIDAVLDHVDKDWNKG